MVAVQCSNSIRFPAPRLRSLTLSKSFSAQRRQHVVLARFDRSVAGMLPIWHRSMGLRLLARRRSRNCD